MRFILAIVVADTDAIESNTVPQGPRKIPEGFDDP